MKNDDSSKKLQEIRAKIHESGPSSLTEEEANFLRFSDIDKGKMIDSENYSQLTKDNIKARQDSHQTITNEEKAVMVGKEQDDRNDAINDILTSYNDIWSKDYDFNEDHLKFSIAIKAPTIAEKGQIVAMANNLYLQGGMPYQTMHNFNVFNGLATIRICGKVVPDFLKDDDHMYATTAVEYILEKIYLDYSEWLSRFRY